MPPESSSVSTVEETNPTTSTVPDTAQTTDAIPQRRRSSRHSRSHRHHRRDQRNSLFWVIIGIALLVNFFILLFFGLEVYKLNKENTVLRISLTQNERELEQTRPELEKLRKDIEDLNQGRLPGLKKLEYDQVIPLNDTYLKNINFTGINDKDTKGYEYKLVLQNDTLSTVWPKLKIHFFNNRGIQINMISMTVEKKDSAIQVDTLGPGETRSYSATIKTAPDEEKPTYFMVERQGDGSNKVPSGVVGDSK